MKNYVWIIVLIVWTLGMLIAAFFGMKEDLKNKKNDSPENRKPVKRLFFYYRRNFTPYKQLVSTV